MCTDIYPMNISKIIEECIVVHCRMNFVVNCRMNIVVNYGINIRKSSNEYRMNYQMDIVVNYQMHNLIYQTILVKMA